MLPRSDPSKHEVLMNEVRRPPSRLRLIRTIAIFVAPGQARETNRPGARTMTHFTCVRVERIRNRSELARIASHGLRFDPSSKQRVDPERTPLNRSGSDYAENPLDLSTALEGFLKANGARLYGRAPIGLHILVSVSPGWITEVGELHDPQNTRNVQLAHQAVEWVQRALGGGDPASWPGGRTSMRRAAGSWTSWPRRPALQS